MYWSKHEFDVLHMLLCFSALLHTFTYSRIPAIPLEFRRSATGHDDEFRTGWMMMICLPRTVYTCTSMAYGRRKDDVDVLGVTSDLDT